MDSNGVAPANDPAAILDRHASPVLFDKRSLELNLLGENSKWRFGRGAKRIEIVPTWRQTKANRPMSVE